MVESELVRSSNVGIGDFGREGVRVNGEISWDLEKDKRNRKIAIVIDIK